MNSLTKIGLILFITGIVLGVTAYVFMVYTFVGFINKFSAPHLESVLLKPRSTISLHYIANGSAVEFYFVPTKGVKIVGISALAVGNVTGCIFLPSHSGNITIINLTNKTVIFSYALKYVPASYYNYFKFPNFLISFAIEIISIGSAFILAGVLFIAGIVLMVLGLLKKG